MKRLLGVVLLALLPRFGLSHHSSAEFDFALTEELEGEIASVLWRNPHVRLTLRAPDAQGAQRIWELEAQDVNSLGRRGLSSGMLRVGDQVKVAGHPSRQRPLALFVTNVLLPTGTEIRTRGENTAPRWSTRTAGFVAPTRADASAQALAARGIFRVWLRPPGTDPPLAELPLTAAARAVLAAWNPADDAALKCLAPGMPGAMRGGQIHPIELVERDGDIVIRVESFDGVRTVHLRGVADPAAQPVTRLGYSVGHWEGDTLVVHTTRIAQPQFDANGRVPLSAAAEVVERFSLSADTDQLRYEQTVTDPATFTAPVATSRVYDWRPELVIERYECTLDAPSAAPASPPVAGDGRG